MARENVGMPHDDRKEVVFGGQSFDRAMGSGKARHGEQPYSGNIRGSESEFARLSRAESRH